MKIWCTSGKLKQIKSVVTEAVGMRILRNHWNYLNRNIIKFAQDTGEGAGEMRKYAVLWSLVKKHDKAN